MTVSLVGKTRNDLKSSFEPLGFVYMPKFKGYFYKQIHKEILRLMGETDIDCRDEKDTIIIDLAGQLDVCNSHKINLFVMPIWTEGLINSL
jgi:hypothetical protein